MSSIPHPKPKLKHKPHAVLVPYPSQGHITPFLHLAKLLHSRGVSITFVNTEFNHARLVRTKGLAFFESLPPNFRFEIIPDGLHTQTLGDNHMDATQDVVTLCDSTRKNCLGPFRKLLARMMAGPSSGQELGPITCVIADGVMDFAMKAAQEMGIVDVRFWTASACGFMGYLHFRELKRRGIVPFTDQTLRDGTLEAPIDWIPGMRNIRLKDLPNFITFESFDPSDIMFDFMGEQAQSCLKSSAIIFNTFDALEHEVLEAIGSNKFPRNNMYTIGPLHSLAKNVPISDSLKLINSSLWKEDMECLEWLDKREPNSVVYVNYGSITVMSPQHLQEFAWGLANSNQQFLWVVRPDLVIGGKAALPQEFLEETKERGLLVSWCPQEHVLSHPSVGTFLTHCGWNSMLEAISGGVPVICWPFFVEQHTNCRYACTDENWGMGLSVDHDVKRDEIEMLVREMVDGKTGHEMRRRARGWKTKAQDATTLEGSSYHNFDRFIDQVLN